MAALDDFRINDPNFQNTANELANRAYEEARATGLSHVDALYAMTQGPMGLNRDLLSVTGSRSGMHGYTPKSIRDARLRYSAERLLPPPAEAAPALTPSHLTGPKMGSAPQPALQTGAYAPEMPVNDVERPLTEAQIHARNNEPAVNMFTGADGELYPAGHPMLTKQAAILSDDTGADGNYTPDARAALLGPTANEIRANRRSGIMMNQDPARYLPDGSSLDDGMGNTYRLDGDDQDAVFQSLVKRYLDEGLTRDAAVAKANERMEMSAPESLQSNLTKAGQDAYQFLDALRVGEHEKRTTPALVSPQQLFGDDKSYIDPPSQPAALTDTTTPVTAGNNNGALTATSSQNTQPAANRVRASTGGYTGNARGSGLPDMQIGLGERLMRMGMAGLANASQGSLAQMGAMTGAYNDVNQANRQAEMGTFKIEEERRQAHAARVAALAASKNKGAGDMGKLKDFQAKNFGFYNRGVDAEKALMDTAGMGTDLWEKLKSNVPLFGNALVDPKYQRYDQARRNFVNAVLRRESGAVISDAEFENANIQYFPQFGDTEETLSQKQRNRQITMEGIRMGAGPSIFYTPTYPMAGGGSTVTIGNMKITEAPAKTAK